MKLVQWCIHLKGPHRNWMDKDDEGKYTIILDLCRECFTEQLKDNPELISSDVPVHMWTGETKKMGDFSETSEK